MKGTRDIWGKPHFRLAIIICAVLLVEAASLIQYRSTRRLLDVELEKRAEIDLTWEMQIILNTLRSAEMTMQEHLWDIRTHLDKPDSMFSVTRRLISANPYVIGGEIAFVHDYYPQMGTLFEPYAHKEGGVIVTEDISDDGHDYTLHPAFRNTVESGAAAWSDPYLYGEGSEAASLTTYSYPLQDSEGRTAAVCGLDIDLSWLSDTLNSRSQYPSSFGFLLTPSGELAGNPPGDRDIEYIVGLAGAPAAGIPARTNDRVRLVRFRDPATGERARIYHTSMRENPYWQVATVSYDKEIYAPAYRMRLLNFLLDVLGLLILFFIVGRYAREARRLNQAELEQARIGSELRVAKDIQTQMLPESLPMNDNLDIQGFLEPAREVGGDLYDYFIRDGRLFFCIGDVSGKGVPSAMLMAVAHSLFRLVSEHQDDPSVITQALNEASCKDNRSNMFVTFFTGVLDLASGQLRYCNAGHDRPILVGDTVEDLPVKANMPLGVFDDFVYEAQELILPSEATLFLYTDGLTEAKDVARKQFSKTRVKEVLERERAEGAGALTKAMGTAVRAFTDGAEQSDDLTMLAIRYKRPETDQDKITLENDLRQISMLSGFVKSMTARAGLPEKDAKGFRLAVEEAVVNVMSYAYPSGIKGDIEVGASSDGQALRVTVSDGGVPFDPTAAAPADTGRKAEDRPVGGLGIHLIRELADSMDYERKDGRNVLTITKKIQKT